MSGTARKFDPLSYSNELRKIGVPEDQANLQANALLSVVNDQLLNKQDLDKVETKLSNDIKEVKAEIKEIKAEIEKSELRLRGDIKDSELRLTIRTAGIVTLVMAVFKFLPFPS